MTRTITDEELNAINRAILTRYGLDFFHYEPTSFKRRVSRVIDKFGLDSSLGLWQRIIQDKDFIYVFIDEITVGLTEMFRNSDFWIKLRNELLPELNEKTAFSIWHAGCSTGEEVYSMAILLSEANLLDKATMVATDLNSQSIRLAQEGRFSGLNYDTYHANYRAALGKGQLSDYYVMKGEDMCFNHVDTRHVQFYQHNLSKDGMNQQFDIIFCRNVMIYFDEVLKLKVLELFNHSLKEGGLLIIGYYDALPADYRKWFTLLDPRTRIFRKSPVNQLILQAC